LTEHKSILSSKEVQELRKLSNNKFPAMHCAKALSQTNGNLKDALVWMYEHPGFYL